MKTSNLRANEARVAPAAVVAHLCLGKTEARPQLHLLEMSIPFWLPPFLTFLAAVLAGVLEFLQHKVQSQKSVALQTRQMAVMLIGNGGKGGEDLPQGVLA